MKKLTMRICGFWREITNVMDVSEKSIVTATFSDEAIFEKFLQKHEIKGGRNPQLKI
eukprot:UN24953